MQYYPHHSYFIYFHRIVKPYLEIFHVSPHGSKSSSQGISDEVLKRGSLWLQLSCGKATTGIMYRGLANVPKNMK